MSAHWYWDWSYGSGGRQPPDTQPALRRGNLQVPGGLLAAAKNHKAGEPAPFPAAGARPCEKLQVYAGQNDPGGAQPPSPPWPDGVTATVFKQFEEYFDTASNTWKALDNTQIWYYWIACLSGVNCCPGKGNCELYTFRVQLPNTKKINGVDTAIYIWDFKCKCHNQNNPKS